MADWEAIVVGKVEDLGGDIKEFRNEVKGELRIQRHETQQGFAAVNKRLGEHGERITKVETRITDLIPKVDTAAAKANGASTAVAGLSGKWSTGWKIVAAVLGGSILGVIGWIMKSIVGG